MRSSVSVLSSRWGVAPAVCSGASSAPSRARRVVAAAALPQRRRLRSGLPTTTTEKASSTMQVKALSGDETGLVTALSSAPPEAMYALGAGESSALKIASECALLKEKGSEMKTLLDGVAFQSSLSFDQRVASSTNKKPLLFSKLACKGQKEVWRPS